MQFDSISAFFDMGGYAFFVWLSYGVTAFLLAALIYSSHSNHKKVKLKIAQRLQREKKLRKAAEKQIAKENIADQESSAVENSIIETSTAKNLSKNINEVIS
jgi:heme exporter protein D